MTRTGTVVPNRFLCLIRPTGSLAASGKRGTGWDHRHRPISAPWYRDFRRYITRYSYRCVPRAPVPWSQSIFCVGSVPSGPRDVSVRRGTGWDHRYRTTSVYQTPGFELGCLFMTHHCDVNQGGVQRRPHKTLFTIPTLFKSLSGSRNEGRLRGSQPAKIPGGCSEWKKRKDVFFTSPKQQISERFVFPPGVFW